MPKTHTPADTLRRLTAFDPLHESPTKTAREFKTLLRSLAHAIRSEEPELAAAAEFMLADSPDCQQFVAEHDARTIASHTCEICDAEIAEDDLDNAAWSAFAQKGNHP
jgi:hypothetical protein